MARRQRFHSPTSVYHVILRGNDKQPIFLSEGDKSRMCLLLQQGVERFGHSIEAFCFMPNHIHLAIRVSETSISRIIHHLAFRFTRYINRLYNRVGHLFQGRFKSILVDDEDYLKELIRYIHLNPVRAGIVADPQQYIWSSHRAYMGLCEYIWLSKDRVLMKFHPEKEHAINNCKKFVLMGIGVETQFDFKLGCKNGVLGDTDFIDKVLTGVHEKPVKKIELSDLIAKVCELHEITEKELRAPGKSAKQSQARALLAFFVRETNNLTFVNLGVFLGRDPSGLTRLANRFEIKCTQNELTSKKLEEMRCWLSRKG
jgi:putative transposase